MRTRLKANEMSNFLDRIAGAPITWGVDGSPGWGYLMDRERVLTEMSSVGISATELGPDGYLPSSKAELDPLLQGHGLELVGGFVPAVLYRDDLLEGQLAYVDRAAATLAGAGSDVLVLGPASHLDGYDERLYLDPDSWSRFIANVPRLMEIVERHGLKTALHPHWAMAVERREQVEGVLEGCDVDLCLDTGHLYLGGTDPVDIAKLAGDRVIHVHIKDVDGAMASEVRNGTRPFRQAVIDGLFTPVGQGDVDIEGVVRHLESIGYQGWYVLEQDKALSGAPGPGQGPIEDAQASVEYLRSLRF